MNKLALPKNIIELAIDKDPYLKSQHSKRQYKAHVRDFELWRSGKPITAELVKEYMTFMQKGLAPSTINQRLAAVRWLAKWIVEFVESHTPNTDEGRELAQEAIKQAAAVIKLRGVTGSRPPRGRHLSTKEVTILLQVCSRDISASGRRDAAMIAVAWTAGLRRDEICNIKLADVKHTEEGVELHVIGKGDKFRSVPLKDWTMDILSEWLFIRGEKPGYLFCRIYKGDNLPKQFNAPLSGEALRIAEEKRKTESGIEHFTWHDFRRTYIGNLFDANVDISTAQELAGHANPTQTQRYDRRPRQRMRAAIETLPTPEL